MSLRSLVALVSLAWDVSGQAFGSGYLGFQLGQPSCGDDITMDIVLAEDLDCDCTHGPALTIKGHGNTLKMNGHRVSCNHDYGGPFYEDVHPYENVGIRVEGHKNCVIGPGNITETRVGIFLDEDGSHLLERVSITQTTSNAIHVESAKNVIDTVYIEDTLRDGIEIAYGDNNVVKDSKIYDAGASSNVFTGQGINVRTSFNLIERNHLEQLTHWGDDGIDVEGRYNRIVSNTIVGVDDDGIDLETSTSLLTAERRNLLAVDDFGGHEVVGNTIMGVSDDCILLVDDINIPVKIVGNHLSECGDDGIQLFGLYGPIPHYHEFRNNFIIDVDDDGIGLDRCIQCIISGNIVQNSGNDGLYLDDNSDDCVIENNHFTTSGDDGVDLVDPAIERTIISGNVFHNNGGNDVEVDGGAPANAAFYLSNNHPYTPPLTAESVEDDKDEHRFDEDEANEKGGTESKADLDDVKMEEEVESAEEPMSMSMP